MVKIFGILPNAIVADIAEFDAKGTGSSKEAMFFGVRTFMSKLGQMIAMLCFGSFFLLGKERGNDFGIRLTAIAAALISVVAMILSLKYNEKKVLGKEPSQLE